MEQDMKTLYAFFDFEVCPVTFDFVNFLCMANAERERQNCDWFRVVVLPGSVEGFRMRNSQYSAEHKRYRVRNIVQAGCALHPNCCGFQICISRADALHVERAAEGRVFPVHYQVERPFGFYNWGATNEMFESGYHLPTLQSNRNTLGLVSRWLEKNCGGRDAVVITLRECDYEKPRNSNLAEWRKFADKLDKDRFCPVFVRDQATAMDPLPPLLQGMVTCKEAPWNLEFRMALYELAYASLIVNNGPWLIGLFNPSVNSLSIKILTETLKLTSKKYLEDLGFVVGQNLPFMAENQVLVWKDDSFDNIQAAFDGLNKTLNSVST